MQHGGEATSWRRHSDGPRLTEARQLASWENEGGTPAVGIGPARVLVVDNDMVAADSLETMLHALGYSETRVAYSGHAALAIASDFRPGIVMVELDLLDMDGYELATRLGEGARSRALRLIAVTSSREHPRRETARSAGFERYLLKPVAVGGLSTLLELPFQ